MSLTRKLLSASGVMLGVMLLISSADLMVTQDLKGDLNRAANITARRQYLAGEVSTATAEMAGAERGSVLASVLGAAAEAEQYRQSFATRAARLQQALRDLHGLSEGADEGGMLATLDRQTAQLLEAHQELHQASAGQQMDAALQIEPEIDDSQHAVKYRITIREGDIYKMGDLEILGLRSRTKDLLQNNWTLLTGDTYNSAYTRRFVAQALKDVLNTGEWNTDIQETLDRKDKTVDVTLHFVAK
jgi:Skp family chaperone for outer membrane proteins